MALERSSASRFRKTKDEWKAFLKRQLKGLGEALLFYGVVGVILLGSQRLLQMYFLNPWITGDVAIGMLNAVIEVDGALIGFTGIIAVYGLREVSRTIEKIRQAPEWERHRETLEGWQTNFLYLISAAVIIFATSVLFSLRSISYTNWCALTDNQFKCVVLNVVPSFDLFLTPLGTMFLGMAGIVWMIRSLRNPLKN